jgi:hypothetical protein
MKKLYLIIGLNLIIFNISNAQVFDWASWTTGATSATLSNGNCNMNVNVAGSLFQNTAPRFDDAGVTYSPTNGTGLALDHNWANLTTSTTVTMNFSASATNPSFNIFDINRNNPCAAFCTASWTDRVVITTSPAATINVTQAQPGEQTVTGNGTGTVTVVGNMVCNGVNGLVTINITGTVNSITVTYNSAPTVDRTSAAAPNLCGAVGGETNCRNNRVACTDPGRQFITIGNVNVPNHTITAASNRTVCLNNALTDINMALGGGATNATVSGLPSGLTATVSGSNLRISGTPTQSGRFNFTVTTSGNPCSAAATTNGIIDVIGTGGTRLAPSGQQCAGTILNFQSIPTGGNGVYTINWGADRDNNGSFELSGSGTNFSFTSVNAGIAAITNPVQLTVTSNGVNCTQTFTPTINPIPSVNDPADQTLCSGQQTSAINFSGNGVSGTTFNWSNSNSAIGLAANGTGNIAAFTASAGSATVTVTPTANTCNGSPQVFSFNIDVCLLPVELMYFNAKKEAEGYHYLYWATATEQNCAYFELEYSTDAVEFSSISKVYSKAINGNSNEALYYDFYNSPDNAAVHYYRLKQSDLDGTFYYSDLIALSDKTLENSIALYPNPAKGAINLQIPNSLIGQNYEIYNIAGQFVSSGKLNSTFHVINLEAIPQGFYVLLINKGIYQSKFNVK